MVYSASYLHSIETHGNSSYFFIKQLIFVFFGLIVMFITYKSKISFWVNYIEYIILFFTILLLMTFLPVIGIKIKGAHRWINLFFISFQPAELFKYFIIIYCAKFFSNFATLKKNIKYYILLFLPLFLLAVQPDFGSLVICSVAIVLVAYLSNLEKKVFYSSISVGLLSLIVILISKPYRIKRLMAYIDPWANEQGSGFQVIQSFLAFAGGGFFGRGLGNSHEKLFYLPEAHNDFIFSVLGEELGFVGVFSTILLFIILFYYGFKISTKLQVTVNKVIVTSIVFTITLQVLLNISVVLGLLPTKGLALPFISAGGSSILSNFFAVGIILSSVKNEISYIFKGNENIDENN